MRKIAGGDTYVVIYLKMMLFSMNTKGKISYEGDADDFVTNLAIDIDEEIENVKVALGFLDRYKLLEYCNEQAAYLTEVPSCIGSECSSAERVRKCRDNKVKALQCNTDVTETVTDTLPSCKNVTLDIRDKIIDIRDIDKEKQNRKKEYAIFIHMTEENYNKLLDMVNGNEEYLADVIYDCNEWRKDHPPTSKKPNDYLFVKNWLVKELEKHPQYTKTNPSGVSQAEQDIMDKSLSMSFEEEQELYERQLAEQRKNVK